MTTTTHTLPDLEVGTWYLIGPDCTVDRTLGGYPTIAAAKAACPETHMVGLCAVEETVCEYECCGCGGTEHDPADPTNDGPDRRGDR